MAAGGSSDVVGAVLAQPLVDHHCHGLVTRDLDRPGFEAFLSEGGSPPPGTSAFDTPLGLAVRRHCAPLLGLEPHAAPEDYLERRSALGAGEVARRLLRPGRTVRFCVDTGLRRDEVTTPGELAAVAGGRAHEIVRLETVAEDVAAAGVGAGDFAREFATRLDAEVGARAAVGVKSVAAYRVGFRLDPARPGAREVAEAAARWLAAGQRTGATRWRLDDPVLTRTLLWTAVDLGLPIQLHVGLGDADVVLHESDPSLLTGWLRAHRVPVVLLHCWPYHRTASFLAAVHPHVHLDVGLALHHVGPLRAAAVLAEAGEVTPFGKLLYSSDAYGLPELYHLGALAFRRALSALLDERVTSGEWSAPDAVRFAAAVAHDNAVRVYRLTGRG